MPFAFTRKSLRDKLRRPNRVWWALSDQAILSCSNVLTGILLVRVLGVHDFGIYSLVLIGLQLPATIQLAGILSPMMSMFDQRGAVTSSSYLAAILFHQAIFIMGALAVLLFLSLLPGFSGTFFPVGIITAAGLLISTEYQDLTRRFFFATERPVMACLSDFIAYGARLILLFALAWANSLSLERVWLITISMSLIALLPLLPDIARIDLSWTAIRQISRRHARIGGWMVGNAAAQWCSGALFFLLIGAALGPTQLGAVRAVQNLVAIVNPFLLALENFVPSTTTKAFIHGGVDALKRYVIRLSLQGFLGITLITVLLLLFAEPLMRFVYGRTFHQQLVILAILGGCLALIPAVSVMTAALRSLGDMKAVFWGQAFVSLASVVSGWYLAKTTGVLGALAALFVARVLSTGQLAFVLGHAFSNLSAAARQEISERD